jgi:hypothetical protein
VFIGVREVVVESVRATRGFDVANRYGEAALMAIRGGSSVDNDPVARWESAMEKLYPTSPTARKKGCPRGAFLGLCEEGLVKGTPAGRYTASKDNKGCAVRAAALLIEGKQSWSTSSLWRAVTDDPEKTHNNQMDVVMALWRNDLIVRRS